MRTTLDIDDALMRRAKREAAERGVTLTSLVEQALRAALDEPAPKRYRLRWRTERGRTTPSVDPADRDALYDLLERDR